jgi:hypothetical protein
MYYFVRKYPSFFKTSDTNDYTVDELNQSFKAYGMDDINDGVSLSQCSGIEPSALKKRS